MAECVYNQSCNLTGREMKLAVVILLIVLGNIASSANAGEAVSGWNGIPSGSTVDKADKILETTMSLLSNPENNGCFDQGSTTQVMIPHVPFSAAGISFEKELCFYKGRFYETVLEAQIDPQDIELTSLEEGLTQKYGPPPVVGSPMAHDEVHIMEWQLPKTTIRLAVHPPEDHIGSAVYLFYWDARVLAVLRKKHNEAASSGL